MFQINEDNSIYVTRGDEVYISVSANKDDATHKFKAGDVLRIKVFAKKDCTDVVLEKDFPITAETEIAELYLDKNDTKIGDVISKPKDYWYEVELNPYDNPQTIIGYDEDGAKVFKLFPEGRDLTEDDPVVPEDIPIVDKDLDLTSQRPVENQAIARAVENIRGQLKSTVAEVTQRNNELSRDVSNLSRDVGVQKARVDNLVSSATVDDAELLDVRVGEDGTTYGSAGDSVRQQIKKMKKRISNAMVFLNNPVEVTKSGNVRTVKFTGNTIIFYNSRTYTFSDVTVSIDYTGALYSLIYCVDTGDITIQYYNNVVPENCIMFGTVYNDRAFLNLCGTNTYRFDSTLDSERPINQMCWTDYYPTITYTDNAETGERIFTLRTGNITMLSRVGGSFVITERTVEITSSATAKLFQLAYSIKDNEFRLIPHAQALPKEYYLIGIYNTEIGLFLCGYNTANSSANLTLAPLILGNSRKCVEIDTINKTITFPNDTLIMCNLDNKLNLYQRHYQLLDSAGNTSVSWADSPSSAQIIYFNPITEKLGTAIYSARLPQHAIVLAAIRTSGGGKASINAPYKIDGRLFNITKEDIGDLSAEAIEYYVKAVNHRGYCTEAPENTLSAYRLSRKHGFKYVECDISFTADGVPVLLHDATIDRTSNGTGNIADMTLDEARAFDFGSWFSSSFVGEQIPTAEEFIALCRKLALHPYIELKTGTESQIKALVSLVKNYGMLRNVTWISFSATYLEYVKSADSKARLGYVVDSITSNATTKAVELKNDNNEVFIDTGTTDNIALCRDAEIPVECWTVNNEETILKLDPYISGVTSDNMHAGQILFNAESV